MKKGLIFFCLFSFYATIVFASTIDDYFYKLDSYLNKGKYISENELFIVGSNGYVIFSPNNGKDWERKLTYTNEVFSSMEYVKENNALYVIGSNGYLLKSTDKGNNWEKIELDSKSFLYSISFSNNIGIIAGDSGTVFMTHDFGKNWIKEVKFTNTKIRFSIIVEDEIFLVDNSSIIFSRKINENNWKVTNQNGEIIPNEASIKLLHYKDKLFLLTNSHLLYKMDKSEIWNTRNLDTARPSNLFIFEENVLSIVFPKFVAENYIFFSALNLDINDLNSELTPYYPNFEKKYYMSSSYCTDIFEDDSKNNIFAIGTNGTVVKYDNIKNHWYVISHQNSPNGGFCRPHFVNDSIGFIAKYRRVVEKTQNFGVIFLPQENEIINQDHILNWHFINSNEFYLLTKGSAIKPIYQTNNGGKDFKQIDLKIGLDPWDYKVFNKLLGVCGVISNNPFQKSGINIYKDFQDLEFSLKEDSCVFTQLTFFSEKSFLVSAIKIKEIYFDSLKSIFRKVQECQIRKTNDFGKTWKSFHIDKLNQSINNLYFVDSLNGFLSGRYSDKDDNFYSCLMRTNDGGETWKVLIDSLFLNLADIYINNVTGFGLLLSSSGFLWTTNNFGNTWDLIIDKEIDNYVNESLISLSYIGNELYLTSNSNLYRAYPGKFPPNLVSVKSEVESGAPPIWLYPPFPNPTKSYINFKLLWSKHITLENVKFGLYDILGNEVENFPNISAVYELENLATINLMVQNKLHGIYYLRANVEGYYKTYPIVFE